MSKHKRIVFESKEPITFTSEDGGMALIVDNGDPENDSTEMFVRIQSWDESRAHTDLRKLSGKRLRVIVEVID
jgi:hypothetical protein